MSDNASLCSAPCQRKKIKKGRNISQRYRTLSGAMVGRKRPSDLIPAHPPTLINKPSAFQSHCKAHPRGRLAARPRIHFYPFFSGTPSDSFLEFFLARGAALLGRVRFRL